jgi:hypothetical protein
MADKKRDKLAERPAGQSQEQQPQDQPPQDQPGPHRVADEPAADADALGATVQSPTTQTGLPVEEQIRKDWDPKKDGGLPVPLSERGRRGPR